MLSTAASNSGFNIAMICRSYYSFMAKDYISRLTDELRDQARYFRRRLTKAERILWQDIRNRQLGGFKFRRQVPIDQFIVDFCCLEKKLVVEIDGEIHRAQLDLDKLRTEKLEILGFRVIRFTNDQVLNDLEMIKEDILKAINPSPPSPLPPCGRGANDV